MLWGLLCGLGITAPFFPAHPVLDAFLHRVHCDSAAHLPEGRKLTQPSQMRELRDERGGNALAWNH